MKKTILQSWCVGVGKLARFFFHLALQTRRGSTRTNLIRGVTDDTALVRAHWTLGDDVFFAQSRALVVTSPQGKVMHDDGSRNGHVQGRCSGPILSYVYETIAYGFLFLRHAVALREGREARVTASVPARDDEQSRAQPSMASASIERTSLPMMNAVLPVNG